MPCLISRPVLNITSYIYRCHNKQRSQNTLNLAVDGITSFSIKPIRLITVLGMVFVGISLGVLCWIAYCNLIGQVVRGWSSLMLSIWFCTGCVLIALGIVGEYVGKTYMETKERPRFIIQDEI